jgi:hypothetical protein
VVIGSDGVYYRSLANGNQNNNEDNDEAAGKGRVHKDALIEGPDLA